MKIKSAKAKCRCCKEEIIIKIENNEFSQKGHKVDCVTNNISKQR
jgi:hypothetical protein